jgi:hypothetical protein
MTAAASGSVAVAAVPSIAAIDPTAIVSVATATAVAAAASSTATEAALFRGTAGCVVGVILFRVSFHALHQ